MTERTRWSVSLLAIGALAGLGVVESARTDHLGLVGLFALIGLVTIGLGWSLRSRAPVPLRADLATWLETAAAITGESATALADRAVSSYRAAVRDDDDG